MNFEQFAGGDKFHDDLRTGEPITVGYIIEYDSKAVMCWLRHLVQKHGIFIPTSLFTRAQLTKLMGEIVLS